MSYEAFPVESFTTELGCKVVRQQQRTTAGLLVENVALIGPRESYEGADCVGCDRGSSAVVDRPGAGDGQAVTEADRAY